MNKIGERSHLKRCPTMISNSKTYQTGSAYQWGCHLGHLTSSKAEPTFQVLSPEKIIEMIEKVTCGEGTRLTSGSVKVDSVKKQAEILLEAYNRAQQEAAAQHGIAMPEVKSTVSERWINRLLSHYGWKRNTPNTLGAYLEFDDERMVKSRKAWAFLRLLGWFWGHLHIYIYVQ